MKNLPFSALLNQKIIAFRGHPFKGKYDKKAKTDLQYILLDDKKTIIQLDDQDPYTYHDCCNSARTIQIVENEEWWGRLFNKQEYKEPDDLGFDPF